MACRLRLALWAGAMAVTAAALAAPVPARAESLPIRLLDEDRLLGESELGQRVVERIRAAEQALEEENSRIADQLAREEQELTEARAELTPEEFRARADEFDQRVEEIRAERAERAEELGRFSEAEVQRFFEMAFPVVAELMREEEVVAILRPESVIVAFEAFDITGSAVERLDAAWQAAQAGGETFEPPDEAAEEFPDAPADNRAPDGHLDRPLEPSLSAPPQVPPSDRPPGRPTVPLIPDDDDG